MLVDGSGNIKMTKVSISLKHRLRRLIFLQDGKVLLSEMQIQVNHT
jgi:hypothetical protein